ncbi:hypothetical protein vseg_014050 [Gypsophila vaccaria]
MMPMAVSLNLNLNMCAPGVHIRSSHSRTTTPFEIQSPASVKVKSRRRGSICICRAELLPDAPVSIAIGASIFSTLLFTSPSSSSPRIDADIDTDTDSSTDARFAVMSIISFIPFFNWLSWVFALMDTGNPRYAVYSLVYLAPYLRTNLSLSPDDSWLPIASIPLCILHIQLEASITSGDLVSFNFFNEIGKRFGFINLKKDLQPNSLIKMHQQEVKPNKMKPPSSQHHSSDDTRKWRVPTEDVEHANEDDGTTH